MTLDDYKAAVAAYDAEYRRIIRAIKFEEDALAALRNEYVDLQNNSVKLRRAAEALNELGVRL